jgi:hypothetical protein
VGGESGADKSDGNLMEILAAYSQRGKDCGGSRGRSTLGMAGSAAVHGTPGTIVISV